MTAATIAAMVLIVPLMVWGGSGSLRHAWHALKQYLGAMGLIVGVGVVVAVIALASELSGH